MPGWRWSYLGRVYCTGMVTLVYGVLLVLYILVGFTRTSRYSYTYYTVVAREMPLLKERALSCLSSSQTDEKPLLLPDGRGRRAGLENGHGLIDTQCVLLFIGSKIYSHDGKKIMDN